MKTCPKPEGFARGSRGLLSLAKPSSAGRFIVLVIAPILLISSISLSLLINIGSGPDGKDNYLSENVVSDPIRKKPSFPTKKKCLALITRILPS